MVDGAGLVALPVVLFFVLKVIPFNPQNGIDPFIYVGYQQNMFDLVTRYGWPYFAVRFGLLVPAQLSSTMLGPELGHFALSYALAAASAAALLYLGLAYGSRFSGWAAAIVCLSSPVFIAAVMTLYADTVGIPCLIAGTALLLAPRNSRRLWVRSSIAGLFYGVAINANLFVLGPLFATAGVLALLSCLRRDFRRLIDLLWVGLGIGLVTLAGSVYYGIHYGHFDVLGPSIEAIRRYSGADGLALRSPDHAWISFSPHLFIPAAVMFALTALLATNKARSRNTWVKRIFEPGTLDALAIIAAVQLFYLFHQFVLDGYSAEAYYYYSYTFPFSIVGLTLALSQLDTRQRSRWVGLVFLVIAASFPIARNVAFQDLQLWLWPGVVIILGLVLVSTLIAKRTSALAAFAGALLVVGVGVLGVAAPRDVPLSPGQNFRWDPHYEAMTGYGDATGLETYIAAANLTSLVPKWASEPGSSIYWYRNDPAILNAIQSTALWRATTLQAGNEGLPALSAQQKQLLVGRTPRNIVILTLSRADAELGVETLSQVVSPLSIKREEISVANSTIFVSIVQLSPSQCDQEWRSATPWWAAQAPCPAP